MKTRDFKRTDGSTGTEYKLEAGDVVTARFDKPRESTKGKFKNFSLGVTHEKHGEIYVALTEAQAASLAKFVPLTGKKITAREYTNDYGKQVGVSVA